jgi:hypothetical protein
MLSLIAAGLLALPVTPTTSTSRVMFTSSAANCGAWKQATLPSQGPHTFTVTDGKKVTQNVNGLVQPSVGGQTLILVFYVPTYVTCPAVGLNQ